MSIEEERKSLENWLKSDGAFGQCPEWYVALKYAAVLNVQPWDIPTVFAERPEWMERAKAMMDAENAVKAHIRRYGRRRT